MEGANVQSIEALRTFRAALIKFAEVAGSALVDSDADVRQTLTWLERDQSVYWASQMRKRHENLERAKEALRHKQVFKGVTGERQGVADEMKAVQRARVALEEAEQKVGMVKRAIQRMHKQMMEYQGQVQRFAGTVQTDIPAAVADLDRMAGLLDQYVNLRGPRSAESISEEKAPEMSRGEAGEPFDWSACREQLPDDAAIKAAPSGLMSFAPWRTGLITPDQLKQLESWRREPVTESDLVAVCGDLASAERVVLCRHGRQWIAAAVGQSEGLVTLTIKEFLQIRPELKEIVSLSGAVLLGIDRSGLAHAEGGDDGRE